MKKEYYQQRESTYGMSHTRRDRILTLASGSGMRVLDIGCAAGALGRRIKENGNWVGGVELSEDAIQEARQKLDRIWSFDLEGAWPEELQQNDLDLIVAGEVLEHFFNPLEVLRAAHRALKAGGSIIVTTPNFMTWTNRIRFLFGNFAYQKEGMFDFGHIRWFTYQYLKDMLTEADFRVIDERHIIFPGKLTRPLKRWPSLFAWQFVLKAQRL